jgi:hypothetical protein
MLAMSWAALFSLGLLHAQSRESNVVVQWDAAALQGIRDAKLGAPIGARVLAIVHTCIYDAWAAYDPRANGTQLRGALRRPVPERTSRNKDRAISYAAYRALADVMPVDTESVYVPLMKRLGYERADNSVDIETATGIGNVACGAVLEFRHYDKANQLGDLAPGAYSDWSGYKASNSVSLVPVRASVSNPDRWQPLSYFDSTGSLIAQKFLCSHWSFVVPFAMTKGDEFRDMLERTGPAKYGSAEYQRQAEELVNISASLTDRQKMISEYWADGPNSEQPPGHWALLAQFISVRDRHTMDDDAKMFFALTNAMFDAGIAAWDAKRTYDSVRPVTAVSLLFRGKAIRAWGGPGKGTIEMDGSQWAPYQLATSPTPPFPEYVSGHSTFSAAAARTLALWTGSDRFGGSATLPKGSSKIEPGLTPAQAVLLRWETFTSAAEEAGASRLYGGIHFRIADTVGRELGRRVTEKAWEKAQRYIGGGSDAAPRPSADQD